MSGYSFLSVWNWLYNRTTYDFMLYQWWYKKACLHFHIFQFHIPYGTTESFSHFDDVIIMNRIYWFFTFLNRNLQKKYVIPDTYLNNEAGCRCVSYYKQNIYYIMHSDRNIFHCILHLSILQKWRFVGGYIFTISWPGR